MEQQKLDVFLEELKQLSLKHGIYIGGCGCCGSPYLFEELITYEPTGELLLSEEEQRYTVTDNPYDQSVDSLQYVYSKYPQTKQNDD